MTELQAEGLVFHPAARVEPGRRTLRRQAKGYVWFACRFGVKRLVHYERQRKSGLTIDYAEIFDDERARLGRRPPPAPWEMVK